MLADDLQRDLADAARFLQQQYAFVDVPLHV